MKTKILVVDDSAVIRHIISKNLSDRKRDVFTALNGYEGLQILDDIKIDVVISDYCMPIMNGHNFLKEVRKKFPNLPFIFFTSEIDNQLAKKLQDNFNCLIIRKCSLNELDDVLLRIVDIELATNIKNDMI